MTTRSSGISFAMPGYPEQSDLSSRYRLTCLFGQLCNTITQLGTAAFPEIDALQINAQRFRIAFRNRVKKPQTLNVTTIPLHAAVSDDDVIKRTLFGAAPR